MPQDKNALKFILRVFIDNFSQYINLDTDKHLVEDVHNAYQNLCDGNQAHLNLSLLKYLFNESIYNQTHRRILDSVLSN
jgi:hypothetical protein